MVEWKAVATRPLLVGAVVGLACSGAAFASSEVRAPVDNGLGVANSFALATTLTAQQSDPREMGWMEGFPPPVGKRIMQPESDFFSFPKLRWTVCHVRELMPTTEVARDPFYVYRLPDVENREGMPESSMPKGMVYESMMSESTHPESTMSERTRPDSALRDTIDNLTFVPLNTDRSMTWR